MAAVTLGRLWINSVDDPSIGMGLRLADLESDPQMGGEVRQYGERLRFVGTTTKAQQLAVTVRLDTRAEVAFVETWQGEDMWVRDPRGRKFAAVYIDPKIPEKQSPDAPVAVTLTFNEISASEAV